jgi:phosphonate transport system substrate-binding protein
MLLAVGVDPRRDLSRVVLTGSHSSALQAVAERRVDAAAASLTSYERALGARLIAANQVRILARSEPIPNPFLAMRSDLPAPLKEQLRAAFSRLHQDAEREHLTLRGYGGKKLDRWETDFAPMLGGKAAATVALIDADFRSTIITNLSHR